MSKLVRIRRSDGYFLCCESGFIMHNQKVEKRPHLISFRGYPDLFSEKCAARTLAVLQEDHPDWFNGYTFKLEPPTEENVKYGRTPHVCYGETVIYNNTKAWSLA